MTLSAASGWEVTVDWATSAETGATAATSGTDFTAASDTLTFMPGETTATFTVATEQDTVDEDNETFMVTLSNPSDAMLATDPTATGTIDDDDDPATLGFEDDAEASEGDDVTFTLTLSPVSDREVTVNWATSVETGDTATSGTDFTAVPATKLTLMPGETTATFTVQTTADSTSEDNETFTVTLSKPSNATLAADPTATGTIGDDDAFAQPQTSCAPNPDDIWCGVVTVMEYSIGGESYDGFLESPESPESPESVAGDLSEKNFTYGENRYTIDAILVGKPTGDGEGRFLFSLTSELTQSDKAALVLYVGSTAIPFAVSHYFGGGGGHWYFWEGDAAQEGSLLTPGPGLDWRSETTVTVRLREASTTCTPQGAIWCGVVTPGDLAGEYGFLNQIGLLSDTDFEHDGTPYTIDEVSVSDSGQLRFSLTADLTDAHRAALALHVDGSSGSFALQSASHVAGSNTYAWLDTGLDWSSVPPATLRLRHTAPTFPGKPTNLTATGNGSTQIDLGWDAPDAGTAAITGYKIEVWADAVTGWTDLVANTGNADTTYAHTGLSAGDTRHYRVSAINTNGTSVPSDERSATTLTNVPVFTDATATRMVAENSAADTNVGDAFREATDADGDPLTYSMEGTDTASFTFDASTRQIKTKTGVTYNFEAKNTYSVTVKADDGTGGTDIIAVTITLTNVDEGQSGTVSIDDTAPMVDDELTASTAEVDDPDGLPDPFAPTWQWYRTPAGGSETEIAGESSATYTVVEADLGAALTAKASWTDAGGFANTLASTATAAVTPLPTVTVAAATGGETVAEGTDAAFTLSRTGATTAALAVAVAVAVSETGAVLDDAASSPSSVTFDVGSDEATLALATNDDDTDDDDGTVTVTLGAGAVYTVGDPGAATVAVSDNDVPVDFVLAVPATVAEDAGPATVTVTATTAENAPPATAVEVQLSRVGGTSTSGSDHDAVSETARFQVSDFAPATVDGQPRYQAEWTHDVVIHDDDVVEDDETVVLEMSPTSAFLLIHTLHGAHNAVQATLTIVDNDVLPNVAPSFTSPETFTPEENQTTVGTVAASDDDMDDAITGYALSGGADQALFAIDGTNGALTFKALPDYEDPQDADTDNAYVVEVQATSGTGDRVQMAPQTITVTVMNVDEGQSGTVSIDATAPMVGDELTASTAEVDDPDGLPDPFEPTWKWYRTPAGGAEAVISGAASATYTVVEADLGAALTAQASWTDDGGFANTLASAPTSAVTAEDSGTLPELSVADASATEGSPVTFTVTLSPASTQTVTVDWATSVETGDTAIAGTDFTAVPAATLTFMPSDTTQTVTVQTTVDSTDEANETFTVTLSNPSNATLAVDPTATGTIGDDGTANVAPSFTSPETFTPEENQTTVGTVAASDDDTGDDITGYALSGGADQALFAIDGTNGALTFETAPDYEDPQDADTDNAYLVEVQATSGTGDRVQMETQTITVTVTNADEGQSGTVSIDDTAPMVGDELTASTAEVADPDGLPDPFEPTWKWYRTPSGGSETEIAGESSATYTVVEADLGAALTAKASWTDAGAFANTLASAATSAVTATLPDLSVADAEAAEGEDVTFTVTLSAAAAENVTVNWATSAETG